MKKFILPIAALSLCFQLSTTAYAETVSKQQTYSLKNDAPSNIKWNDEHDRLLVDSDFVEEFFGVRVEVKDNAVDIYKGEHTLHFEPNNEFYIMDGLGGRKIGALTQIEYNKAWLPLRYICEAFGSSVEYNNLSQTVSISKDTVVLDESIKKYFENVSVYDQSTVKITGEKTIYTDPRRILGEPHDADIIFITHTHNDHYEIDSIKKVMKPSTVVYVTMDGVEQAKADGLTQVIGVEPGSSYNEQGIAFSTVAAYNTAEDRQNHKQEFNWVGYIVKINGYSYYFAGDTDFIPEMKSISETVDVAFLPIDGKYNMDIYEAAEAANAIMPKAAAAYHYNNFISEDKALEFTGLLNNDIKGAVLTFKMQ